MNETYERLRAIHFELAHCVLHLQRSMLQSVYQRAGLLYFKDTLFEEAFGHFRKGDIDPEILISLFPDIAGPNLRREQVVNDASAAWASKLGTINDIGIAAS